MDKRFSKYSEEVLENTYRRIEALLYESCSANFLMWTNDMVAKGILNKEDLIETGGYRKGLKVALEVIRSQLITAADMDGALKDDDCFEIEEIAQFIRGKNFLEEEPKA